MKKEPKLNKYKLVCALMVSSYVVLFRSYIAIPANSWVDDFIDWLNPGSRCCRLYTLGPNQGEFCPANISEDSGSVKDILS